MFTCRHTHLDILALKPYALLHLRASRDICAYRVAINNIQKKQKTL